MMGDMADNEADNKMPMSAGLAEHEWNGISNEDDSASLGSLLSVDSWELHFDELREHMRIDYPTGGFVNVGRCNPLLGDWISRQRIQYHRKGCGYACPLSDDRIQKLEDIGFWWDHKHPGQEIIETSPPPDAIGATKKLQQKEKGTPQEPKERTHYELIAQVAAAWWSKLKPSETRRYMDMSTQGMDQGTIESDDDGPKMSQSDADATATVTLVTPTRTGEKKSKKKWLCDFCKAKHFEEFEEACAHEKQCEKQMKEEQQKKLLREQQEQKQAQEKKEMQKQQQVPQQEKQKVEVESERTIHKEAPNTATKEQRTDTSNHGLNRKQSPEALKHEAKKQKTETKVPWEANYERLVQYIENHGSGYVLPPTSDGYFSRWVSRQRSDKKSSKMSSDRISKLESIGFLWENPGESAEKESFSGEDCTLGWQTQEESSHCSTQSLPYGDESVETAGDSEQANHTQSTIHEPRNPAPKKHRMDALNRDLETKQCTETPELEAKKQKTDVPWEANYARLVKYVENHGSGYILPPTSDMYFSKWVDRQRSDKKGSKMSSYRISKLESIGFLWEKPDESAEEESCKSREDASGRRTRDKETHHSSNCNSSADDESLDTAGHLAAKSSGSESCTTEDRVSRVAPKRQNKHRRCKAATKKPTKKRKTGVPWEENYERLVKYVENHGSGYICPRTPDAYFNRWVTRQRSDKKRSILSSDRISKLESIGYLWEKPDESTATESCSSKEDLSGWQTQEKESRHASHFTTDSSPDDNESLDTASSERSVIDERVSNAATTRSYDAEINDNLAQISRCLQETLTQKRKERAWKTKYTACKESLRKSEKQVQDLRGQSQNSKKLQAKNHELSRKVEQLKKQNDILTKKDQVGTKNMKQRYLALQQAHKIERERRMEAEAKLQQVTNLLSG